MLFDFLSAAFVHPAECIVKIDGREISELYPFITSISVDASRANNTEAHIMFASPADELDHWQVADDTRLRPDAAITIEADFRTAREEVMRGVVANVTPSFPANAGQATVDVHARDDSARLDRRPQTRLWGTPPAGTSDAIILQTLISGKGVILDPGSGAGHAGVIVNQHKPDLEFLKDRARANGYELLFHRGMVYFGPMRTGGEAQSPIMAYAGLATNCRNFSAPNRGQASDRYSYVRRDEHGEPDGETEVEADEALMGLQPTRASSSLDPQGGRLDRRTSPVEAENEARAQNLANAGQFSIRAEGELDGALYGHVLQVGKPVEVDGVGEQNSGRYYVDQVTHHLDQTGYSQKFVLLRNALGRAPGGGVGSLISAVMGS